MENNIKPVTSPEDAVAQFVGEQYMEWVMDYIENDVKSWGSLRAISDAKPKPEKIKKFMLQRFLAAEAFIGGKDGDPGFLGFAAANLSEASDPTAEHALELINAKRQDEVMGSGASSSGNAHRDLWMRLLHAVGLTDEEIRRAEAKEPTRNYVAELSDVYSNSDWQCAVAAFSTHEKLVPNEYLAIYNMLKANTQVTDADLEVLVWHAKGDAKYVIDANHVLERVAVDEEGKQLIFDGVKRELDARRDFYDGIAKYLVE